MGDSGAAMNDNEAEMSPQETAWAFWSEDPAIRHLIGKTAQQPDSLGLEALIESAFQAGWTAGWKRAME